MKKFILILVFLLPLQIQSQTISQSVLSSGGDYILTPQLYVAWTIGEPVTGTLNNNNYYLTQGFHQNYFVIESAEDNLQLDESITAYPTPAEEKLTLNWKLHASGNIKFELFDNGGKSIYNTTTNIEKQIYQLDLSQIPSGSFILKITYQSGKKFKTIKILKLM